MEKPHHSQTRAHYLQALARLEKNLLSGRFTGYTQQKKWQIWNRLCRYARQLGIKLKVSLAAACLAAGLCFSAPAAAQIFSAQTGAANPFDGVDVGSGSGPAFVDIDGDGDRDAFVGTSNGFIRYYKNTGTVSAPVFDEQTGPTNLFDGLDVGQYARPSFVDVDGDGDQDAFIGTNDGTLRYFKNTGTTSGAVFTEQTAAANPFNAVDVGISCTPAFEDIDGDGDKDAILGAADGSIRYYKNTGTATAALFEIQNGSASPFNGVNVGYNSAPGFVDIDKDGDMDAFIGNSSGTIAFYKNRGISIAPIFTLQISADNPLNSVNAAQFSTPAFADIDNDGNTDAFIGAGDGTISYYKNTPSTPTSQPFTEQTGLASLFNGVDVVTYSRPAFVDIDADGDQDAFLGRIDGTIMYFKNTGTSTEPVFSEQTGAANPFNGVNVGGFSGPSFVDIDGDGDKDAFTGATDGTFRYYKNTGTTAAPVFTVQTGAANPFDVIDVGAHSSITFVDIDADGDMDAFTGGSDSRLRYYKNTGTSAVPVITPEVGVTNPFNLVFIGNVSNAAFVDMDADGDMDVFTGSYYGTIRYFKNTGTAVQMVVTEQTGASNPLNGVDVGYGSISTFVDIDGDGDMDVFLGAQDGTVRYYRSNATILPLHLLSFSGSRQAGHNHLQWQTATEINTKIFELEMSSDGRNFFKIATINAAGTSSNNYSTVDNGAYNHKVFYRLKMLDVDGRFTYSQVIWIKSEPDGGVNIYPNPVTDLININIGNAKILNTRAFLYDYNGRLMQVFLILSNQHQINVPPFLKGRYIIKFADGSAQSFIKK